MIIVNLGSETSINLSRFDEMLQHNSKLTNVLTEENIAIEKQLPLQKDQSFTIYKVH
jgi:hypothetical protein